VLWFGLNNSRFCVYGDERERVMVRATPDGGLFVPAMRVLRLRTAVWTLNRSLSMGVKLGVSQ